jgi:UDP-2,3-diacylglucosamine pyrophosphatase LpxH
MADIKYVCLSDTHFGAEASLLTNLQAASPEPDPTAASPVMKALVVCLDAVLSTNRGSAKPTLVLNGDIFELALASDEQAAMVFQRFLELVMPAGGERFGEIVYLPGNHDHHLWESARETQYANFLDTLALPKPLPPPWHATKVFMLEEPVVVPAFFPTKLARRYPHLKDFVIRTAYPNFGVRSRDGSRLVLLHHGHYTEPIYTLMSTLKRMLFPDQPEPATAWDIEGENYAWIDYFWSTLGRSGQAGVDVGIVYDKMQDETQFGFLLDNLADGLAHRWASSRFGRKIESVALRAVLRFVAGHMAETERHQTDTVLTPESEKGLRWYVSNPLYNQVRDELAIDAVTSDVTFVFGHTHKPFQREMSFERYPRRVGVYNTGGWTVDAPDPRSAHGGAVVLIDEDLKATSLRMYGEQQDPGAYRVAVEEAAGASSAPNELTARVRSLVDPARDPWKAFSAAASQAVNVRGRNLRSRIERRI